MMMFEVLITVIDYGHVSQMMSLSLCRIFI